MAWSSPGISRGTAVTDAARARQEIWEVSEDSSQPEFCAATYQCLQEEMYEAHFAGQSQIVCILDV